MGLLKKICKNKISLVIIAGIIAFIIYNLIAKRDIDLVKYEEKLLGIEISEYVEKSDGRIINEIIKVSIDSDDYVESEYAIVKLKIKKNFKEEVIKIFDDNFSNITQSRVAPYIKNPSDYLQTEVKNSEPMYIYEVLLEGKKGLVTREINIYLIEENDEMYVYIIG